MRIVQGLYSPAYSTALQILQDRESPAYSAGPTKPWVYFRAYTALCTVQGLQSPAYSAGSVQPCE